MLQYQKLWYRLLTSPLLGGHSRAVCQQTPQVETYAKRRRLGCSIFRSRARKPPGGCSARRFCCATTGARRFRESPPPCARTGRGSSVALPRLWNWAHAGRCKTCRGAADARRLTAEARAWVVALACQKPKELGYAQELWTTSLLAQHVRQQGGAAGHASLQHLARGTVSKILRAQPVQPHKIEYYLERRDAEFDVKMKQVLHVYRQVELWHQAGAPGELTAVLSYDEKPGIQALENTAPDLPPVPGRHATVGRDHEYVRHGTLSLLAGIDLWNGEVLGLVRERHRSAEFIEFLRLLDARYPAEARIRLVLDNHSAHLSRETRTFLGTRPNRFEFTFTPTHGSWLNLIESFFGKMARTLLRGIRVKSKEELKTRIEMYLREVNQEPVVFRWKYKLETLSVI